MPWTSRKLIQHALSAIDAQNGQMQTGDGPMASFPAYAVLNLARRCEALSAAREPLSDERLEQMWESDSTSAEDCASLYYYKMVARAIERELGIAR